jgi:hypothetical protein
MMFQRKTPAKAMMQMPLPAGGGNYGPDFRATSSGEDEG